MASPRSSTETRQILRLGPTGITVATNGRPRVVYVGALVQEVARRPALFTAIDEYDDFSLSDATISRLAPRDPAIWKSAF